ncbi:MAG: hypothetical protein KC964_12265, partial [Candidatus Omnitrophica bacterium]|nr:hypothetical protein [Candidatus Omnitrophota bacterium]
ITTNSSIRVNALILRKGVPDVMLDTFSPRVFLGAALFYHLGESTDILIFHEETLRGSGNN